LLVIGNEEVACLGPGRRNVLRSGAFAAHDPRY